MAERRMFSKTITNSARFLMMPASARLLYYDLGMAADDDGVVEAFAVMRLSGASEEDLNVLVAKGYVKILNEELVSYICDWKRNNYIQSDRYHPSFYQKLLEKVLGGESGKQTHTGCIQDGYKAYTPVDTSRIQDVYKMDTEDRLGKDRIGQVSSGEGRVGAEGSAEPATPSPTPAAPPPPEKEFFSFDTAASPQADRGSESPTNKPEPDSIEALVAEGISESYINERRIRAEDFARAHKRRLSSVLREWWERDKSEYRDRSRSVKASPPPAESSFDTDDFFEAAVRKSIREMEEMYRQNTGG